ncbi:Nucleosome assembly protein 1;1 [Hondaea fermentalgiana]|uniref:Nucleosome assembly protein 11 n=1 Tax=Hondaea fermentalgiana TaxID=2315210 RepID=A0A2R5GFG0_9STRA|nr:Nucleosome assembly protein 1;1 [Hondaea fermentalgiana]|eukprot:GBG29656.1 Nucleosome assembly protein 1;1 [Hondaea fermentalgiana]
MEHSSGTSTPPPAPPPSRASRASSTTLSGTSTPMRSADLGRRRSSSTGSASSVAAVHEVDEQVRGQDVQVHDDQGNAQARVGHERLVTDRGGSLQVVSLMQRLRPHAKDQELARGGPDNASGEDTDELNAQDRGIEAAAGSTRHANRAIDAVASLGLGGGGGASSPTTGLATPDNTPYYLSDDAGDSTQQRTSERPGARSSKQNMLSAVQARLRELKAQQQVTFSDHDTGGESRDGEANANNVESRRDRQAENLAEEDEEAESSDGDSESSYASVNVDKLLELHDLYLIVQDEYFAARKALERDFREKFGSIFRRRAAVISGADDPEEAIPGFWYIALSRNNVVGELFADRDVEALEALEDIRCVDVPQSNDPNASQYGFRLEFHFRENRFFENKVLHKTYRVPNMFMENSHPVLESIEGCLVVWKSDDVDLTRRRTRRGKIASSNMESDDGLDDDDDEDEDDGGGDDDLDEEEEEEESFFLFFDAPWMEHAKNLSHDAHTAAEHQILLEQVAADFRAGFEIHSKIVPEALRWFTGEAAAEDENDEDDDDDDDDDHHDDDENGSRTGRDHVRIRNSNGEDQSGGNAGGAGGVQRDADDGEQSCKQQ